MDDVEPHTVCLTFQEQDFCVFPSASDQGPTVYVEETNDDDERVLVGVPAPALPIDRSLFWEPLDAVFGALRVAHVLGEFLEEGTELCIAFPDLDLVLREDNVYARDISLQDISQLALGFECHGSLRLVVTEEPRFISRYNELATALGSEESEEDALDEEAGEEDEEVGEEDEEAGEEDEEAGEEDEEAGKEDDEEDKEVEEVNKGIEEADKEDEEAGNEGEEAGNESEEAGNEGEEAGNEGEEAGNEGEEAGEKVVDALEDGEEAGDDVPSKETDHDTRKSNEQAHDAVPMRDEALDAMHDLDEEAPKDVPSQEGDEAVPSKEPNDAMHALVEEADHAAHVSSQVRDVVHALDEEVDHDAQDTQADAAPDAEPDTIAAQDIVQLHDEDAGTEHADYDEPVDPEVAPTSDILRGKEASDAEQATETAFDAEAATYEQADIATYEDEPLKRSAEPSVLTSPKRPKTS